MTGHELGEVVVRSAQVEDAHALAAIYNYFVANTIVTFEEEPVLASELARRMGEVFEAQLPWLVAERAGNVCGYAYATRWRPRAAYRFSVEVTVYIAHDQGRSGLGSALYAELLPALRQRGLHAVMGGIALPNQASVRIHEKFGFKQVAHFPDAGFKFGHWVDVGYWQRVL